MMMTIFPTCAICGDDDDDDALMVRPPPHFFFSLSLSIRTRVYYMYEIVPLMCLLSGGSAVAGGRRAVRPSAVMRVRAYQRAI